MNEETKTSHEARRIRLIGKITRLQGSGSTGGNPIPGDLEEALKEA